MIEILEFIIDIVGVPEHPSLPILNDIGISIEERIPPANPISESTNGIFGIGSEMDHTFSKMPELDFIGAGITTERPPPPELPPEPSPGTPDWNLIVTYFIFAGILSSAVLLYWRK